MIILMDYWSPTENEVMDGIFTLFKPFKEANLLNIFVQCLVSLVPMRKIDYQNIITAKDSGEDEFEQSALLAQREKKSILEEEQEDAEDGEEATYWHGESSMLTIRSIACRIIKKMVEYGTEDVIKLLSPVLAEMFNAKNPRLDEAAVTIVGLSIEAFSHAF